MTEPCRFCLETDSTPSNPFVSPCNCIGSVRYIHQMCLYRWILIEPSAKKMTCSICNKRFQLDNPIENVPQKNALSLIILWNPIIVMLVIQYLKMVWFITGPNPLYSAIFKHVAETQLAFHIMYGSLAIMNVRINRPEAYWAISRGKYVGLALYHLVVLAFTYDGAIAFSYFMVYSSSIFWKLHCDTLAESNAALLRRLSH